MAEIIQRTRPDVLLINEFDFDDGDVAVDLFQEDYLSVGQNGADPIDYPHRMGFSSNTGILSGFDLNNDGITAAPGDIGESDYANDSWGFWLFPGQFAFAVYSMYPIADEDIRTFQHFLWRDMPGALLLSTRIPESRSTPRRSSPSSAVLEEPRRRAHRDRQGDGPLLARSPRLRSSMAPRIETGPGTMTRSVSGPTTWAQARSEAATSMTTRATQADSSRAACSSSPETRTPIPSTATASPVLPLLLEHPRINAKTTPTSEGGVLIGGTARQ